MRFQGDNALLGLDIRYYQRDFTLRGDLGVMADLILAIFLQTRTTFTTQAFSVIHLPTSVAGETPPTISKYLLAGSRT